MHELSICKAIADTAIDHADGKTIASIKLRVGHFRQIVPETLQFCWNMRSDEGPLADCVLEVDYVPAVVACRDCQATTTLAEPILRCRECDATAVSMVSGDEFLIESIDLHPTTEEVY